MHLILLILVYISYCISDSSKDNWYETLVKENADDWIDLRYLSNSIRSNPLSTILHSYAERKLDFDFPFYGDKLGSFLATAQGFLYMGGNYGQALYETKYIAPLMAGFSPTGPPRKPQDVRHFSNGTIYINQWSDMSLESQRDVGVFTFQVQLHSDGVIKFVYKEVPIPIEDINSSHVVKAGISDAYRGDAYSVPYSQLIPYNTILPNSTLIQPDTTVTFTPIPTCGGQRTCKSCVAHSESCSWCSSLLRCSTQEGLEKYHTLWHQHHCPDTAVNSCQGIKTEITPKRPDLSFSTPSHATEANITPETIKFPYFSDDSKEITVTTKPDPKPDEKTREDSASMTIITTISITAVCIAAILVISALLILKLRKPVLSPIKMEEIKSCNENCSRTFIEQNNSQPYPQYQFVMSEDHDHTVSVVV